MQFARSLLGRQLTVKPVAYKSRAAFSITAMAQNSKVQDARTRVPKGFQKLLAVHFGAGYDRYRCPSSVGMRVVEADCDLGGAQAVAIHFYISGLQHDAAEGPAWNLSE